jgi:hypothetical protein
MRRGIAGMDEASLRELLASAIGDEPPVGPAARNSRREGIKLRRHARLRHTAMAAAVAIVAVVIPAGIGALGHAPRPPSAGQRPATVPVSLPTRPASYLGVFEDGAPPGYGPIAQFAQAANARPNLVEYYSAWLEPFNTQFALAATAHGAAPLVQINPTGVSLAAIAAGRYDGYLSSYAEAVRSYRHPVVLGFGHEMNGYWYSWGYRHTTPAVFVAAWRHIVTLFRQLGARNVIWLWTVNIVPTSGGIRSPGPWWPGPQYVTWVGIDGYYDSRSNTFPPTFGPTIAQVRELTDKPILLSDTGVPRNANQYLGILNLFAGMREYKMLGLVWFDNGQSRIEDSPQAESAFKLGAAALRLVRL